MTVTTWRVPQPFTPVFAGLDDIGAGGILNGYVWKADEELRAYVYCQLGTGPVVSGPIQLMFPHAALVYTSDFGSPTLDGSGPLMGHVIAAPRPQPQFRSFGPVMLAGNDRFSLHTHRLEPIDAAVPGIWQAGGWLQIRINGPTRELIDG